MRTLLIVTALAPAIHAQIPVSVRVVNAATKAPIPSATVLFSGMQGSDLSGRSDSSGVFAATAKSSGSHILLVSRSGYRMKSSGVMGNTIDLQPGREFRTTIEMSPLAVISGRILDQYGDPIKGAIVRSIDKARDPGRGEYYQGFTAGFTDDRGEYRISDVEPGDHWIGAEYESRNIERFSSSSSRYRWPQTGGIVFFPGVASIAGAEQVSVQPGEVNRIVDLRINIQRAVSVSGRIKPPPRGEPPPSPQPMVSLERAGPYIGLNAFAGGGTVPGRDGKFQIEVLPGTYALKAADAEKVSRPLMLEVRDKDMTNLELELNTSYELHGRIVSDGPERPDLSKVVLHFMGQPVKFDASGSFHQSLGGGTAQFMLQNLPDDWYLKDVTIAGRHINGEEFQTEPGTSEAVFLLSPRGARVDVKIDRPATDLKSLAMVLLLPEEGPIPRPESMHAAESAGGFVIRGIPPGTYRIFSLDVNSYLLALNPELLLTKYRQLAPLITLTEGERRSIQPTPLFIPPE
ncbi:MAG TPA: carboxypeptidase-like regulatory domain-containing protein [Bryobacteraceae bacterium]|jgi:hypothetical protein|nr:carboxypeptidase-like regulatory domain-containing protein [Bryobacteraceae bacterium]